MTTPGCGGCTLCCTVMKVEMEPETKPAGEKCRHCVKGGCAIYDARPEPCVVWSCVWLLSQGFPTSKLPSALRPDRCGVALEVNSRGYIVAHCSTPAAWRGDAIRKWLVGQARRNRVLIEAGPEEVLLLNGDGSTEQLQFAGLDPATNERRYRTAKAVFS